MIRNQLKDERNRSPLRMLDDKEFFKPVKYPTYHCANIYDIFPVNRDYSFISGLIDLNRRHKTSNKRALAIKVFHEFLRSAINGIIENNDMLILPAFSSCICAESIPDQVWKNRRKRGKFRHFDPITTAGKVYGIKYRFKKNGECRKYEVVLDKARFQRLVDLQNSGKKYFDHAKNW